MNPPFEITPECATLLSKIERLLGMFEGMQQPQAAPMLRRSLRVKTVQGSVAIEGNTLSEEQVTALLEGRRVIGPAHEILEVQNALEAYERLAEWQPHSREDLLAAHGLLMQGLLDRAGKWRRGNVGVLKGSKVAHIAPPAKRVASLIDQLLEFLELDKQTHPIVLAAVIHYELEFIHPFEDGNGRIGRLWHTLILSRYHTLFLHVPVESLIREQQSEYYDSLRHCDRVGESTAFIEFTLNATLKALRFTLDQISPTVVTPDSRIESARDHFKNKSFSRKDYCKLFPSLSTATASRDLRKATNEAKVVKSGEKALTRYVFGDE
jgi:Fic family protein